MKYRQGRPANADKIAEQEKEPSITATDNGGVRQAEFDAGQLDKNVRISYLRNMLMAKAQRKDRIKSGEITTDDMQQPIDKEEMSDLPVADETVLQTAVPLRQEKLPQNGSSVLNYDFARQRHAADIPLERLEMPDSPIYNLAEDKMDFDPEHVAVPSRVDIHEKKRSNYILTEIFSWLKVIFLAIVIAYVFVTFIAQRNIVDGNSMFPTLHNGDNLIVEKMTKYFTLPPHDTIITFIKPKVDVRYIEGEDGKAEVAIVPNPDLPDVHLVKRVIGLPGDEIEIKDGHVYRNGVKLTEDYLPANLLTGTFNDKFSKVKLADDELYVMGDNRNHSLDSRTFGPIKSKTVVGRSLLRFYPFNRFSLTK